MERSEREVAIEINCGAGRISTKVGDRAEIGICGFTRHRESDCFGLDEARRVVAISWVGNRMPRDTTSKEAGAIQAVLRFRYGRGVEGHLGGTTFGNIGLSIQTYVRGDSYAILRQAESTESVYKEEG